MAKNSFRAVIAMAGANPFVDVPAQVSRAFAAFAEHGRVRVAGTINGHPLHATLVPTKEGKHRLYVNGGMRAALEEECWILRYTDGRHREVDDDQCQQCERKKCAAQDETAASLVV